MGGLIPQKELHEKVHGDLSQTHMGQTPTDLVVGC
jgi:hypothetical protein